jgi:hypothetical protein
MPTEAAMEELYLVETVPTEVLELTELAG